MPISIWRKLGGEKLILKEINRYFWDKGMQPTTFEKEIIHFCGRRKSRGGTPKISKHLKKIRVCAFQVIALSTYCTKLYNTNNMLPSKS